MNEEYHHALATIQFSSVLGADQVWSPLNYHVDGLHPVAVDEITRAVQAAERRPNSTPRGLVLSGDRGVGKTHMLGWLRHYVQQRGGSFFMPKLIMGQSFWAGAVHGVVNQLLAPDGGQLGRMLNILADITGCGKELRMRLHGTIAVRRDDLDEFVERIDALDERVAMQCKDTLRALVLYQAKRELREIGYSYLALADGIDESDRAAWGFRRRNDSPQLIFQHVIRLFALTGPVVLALDQVDTVIAESGSNDENDLASQLADGLMQMREETVRTLIVAACIPKSWELIATRATNSAEDRFKVLTLSTTMPSAATASAIVERHLGNLYGEAGFEPPYPTWPVLPKAFDDPDVPNFTPRRLLQLVEAHASRCLAENEVNELAHFGTSDQRIRTPAEPAAVDLATLDQRFTDLRTTADVIAPMDPKHEDTLMFSLLNAALQCYVLEQRGEQDLTVDQATIVQPALHARLRQTLDEANEDEVHWSFRAIAHSHHRAVLTRLRSACLEAGIHPGASKRHLVILRNAPFSTGPVTTAAVAEFEVSQGIALPISADDLRTFTALRTVLSEGSPELLGWLAARRPASRSQLFSRVLAGNRTGAVALESLPTEGRKTTDASSPEQLIDVGPEPFSMVEGDQSTVAGPVSTEGEMPSPTAESATAVSMTAADDNEPSIVLGRNVETGLSFQIPLVLLRKHTAVFAGSGSGKTVLLRRLVEEVAIHGVSSILIDTNNDLSRLGDRWPSKPDGWANNDPEHADRYFADTEVIVWTPRREAGRPLALNPLPDFTGMLDDPDEFRTSIDASVAGLISRAGLTARKLRTGTAVLTQALAHFARDGGSDLNAFVALLGNLPEGVSTVRNGASLAADMADELHAAMINDPVFGGAGARLDPGVLLTPTAGKRARISVISCIGLPTDEQRQTFVNQLELALFAWIKRNPAGDRPIGGLLVLDEAQTFAPSRGTTASTESTLKLATQARKYGLGLVYATQAPKALHNMVTGNAATQLFGRLNAPAQIQAAQELARAKGGRIDDISRLPAGRFYGATEGAGFSKIVTPMCLSHHPASALTEEEVLDRARRDSR
ncbi:helicase HerA domain-containing protein [Nocardia sp. CA-128927]|uniref:ATP-binding protein n=1 Tax=Nocardia sp. CA-128927 TaxID=3239975 RepID=UPI003D95AB57